MANSVRILIGVLVAEIVALACLWSCAQGVTATDADRVTVADEPSTTIIIEGALP